MSRPLTSRVALVTGATGGIGSAIARRLADAGAAVVIAHHDTQAAADALAAEIAEAGGRCGTYDADLRLTEAIESLGEDVLERFQRIDILVSNAGAYPRTPWQDLTPPLWRASLDLNLTAHYLLARAFTQQMIKQRRGRIITIGSVLAATGRHELVDYVSAKCGLEGMTRALARELGQDGITVNCVAPGSIRVPAEDDVVPDAEAMTRRQLSRQCIKRRGQPDDVASAVAFLATDDAGFITGQTLRVDGGWILA